MPTDCRYCAPPRHEEVDLQALLEKIALTGRYGSHLAARQVVSGFRCTQDPQQRLPLETPAKGAPS